MDLSKNVVYSSANYKKESLVREIAAMFSLDLLEPDSAL